ncbi:MAG: FG-GAP repeat domain-containing protein [Phycisphaerales bacterium JB060]
MKIGTMPVRLVVLVLSLPAIASAQEGHTTSIVGDFDKDGDPDWAYHTDGQIVTYLNAGDGTAQRVDIPDDPFGGSEPITVESWIDKAERVRAEYELCHDIDGDGNLDLVCLRHPDRFKIVIPGTGKTRVVLLGDGQGGFAPAEVDSVPPTEWVFVSDPIQTENGWAMLLTDGKSLAVWDGSDSLLAVPLGEDASAFSWATSSYTSEARKRGLVHYVDFDGDGREDIVAIGRQGSICLWLQKEAGRFARVASPVRDIYATRLAAVRTGDVLRLVIAEKATSTVWVYERGTTGEITLVESLKNDAQPGNVYSLDFDGDSTLDTIVEWEGFPTKTVVHYGTSQDGEPRFRKWLSYRNTRFSSHTHAGPLVAVTDFDGDGILDAWVGEIRLLSTRNYDNPPGWP